MVQCCLRKGPGSNQFIIDAIADKCWEIGQGRFGARAVRAILESSDISKEQQVREGENVELGVRPLRGSAYSNAMVYVDHGRCSYYSKRHTSYHQFQRRIASYLAFGYFQSSWSLRCTLSTFAASSGETVHS